MKIIRRKQIMKKLIALLIACTAMTCSFVSCGDEKEESSVSDVSVSESSTDDSSDDSVEEDTSEEETEEATEETTEESVEVTTIEKTTHEYIEDADKTAFLGKWECEKLIVEGEEMTELMGMPLYAIFQLEVREDGTAVMAESLTEYSDSEEAVIYTWGVVSETEMEIVDADNNAMLFTISGDYLVGTEEGYDESLYLIKVDEFTPFDFESFVNDFESDDSSDENYEEISETTTSETAINEEISEEVTE